MQKFCKVLYTNAKSKVTFCRQEPTYFIRDLRDFKTASAAQHLNYSLPRLDIILEEIQMKLLHGCVGDDPISVDLRQEPTYFL